MNSVEANNHLEQQGGQPLPIEVLERGSREREFFDRYTNPNQIPDELLLVPCRAELLDLPPEVLAVTPHLTGKRVCEFGCGYGVISAYFAQKGAQVSGFDISQSNIRVARRTAQLNGVESRVDFQVLQAESTTYPENYFDLVFGKAVLHHLDLKLAALEIFRVLKPGGVAIFFDPLGENKLLEWVRSCPLRSHNHRHTRDERSLRYADLDLLRSVFPGLSYREMALLATVRTIFRKAEAGMIAIPRAERALRLLSCMDAWLLSHVKLVRPFASYLVICLPKPGDLGSLRSVSWQGASIVR